jgi:hypothetical protein
MWNVSCSICYHSPVGAGACVRQLTALSDALVSLTLHLMDTPTCLPVLALAYRLHDGPRQHTLCSAARAMAVRRFRDVNVDDAAHRASLARLPVTLLHRCARPVPVMSHTCPFLPTVARPPALGKTAAAWRFRDVRMKTGHSLAHPLVCDCSSRSARHAVHRAGELSACGTIALCELGEKFVPRHATRTFHSGGKRQTFAGVCGVGSVLSADDLCIESELEPFALAVRWAQAGDVDDRMGWLAIMLGDKGSHRKVDGFDLWCSHLQTRTNTLSAVRVHNMEAEELDVVLENDVVLTLLAGEGQPPCSTHLTLTLTPTLTSLSQVKGSKACMAAATLTYMNKLLRLSTAALPHDRSLQLHTARAPLSDVTNVAADPRLPLHSKLQEASFGSTKRRRME